MNKEIKFLYTDNFNKSFKKLSKKYISLSKDFNDLLLALEINPLGYEPNIVRIAGLGEEIMLPFYKVRKFALTCMKLSNSGIRIIYVYDNKNESIEFIEFTEIYHKNEKENHDIEYIKKNYSGMEKISGT